VELRYGVVTIHVSFNLARQWPLRYYSHDDSVSGDICVHFDKNGLVAAWTIRPLEVCVDAVFYMFVTDNAVFEETSYHNILFTLCCLDGGV